MKKFWTYVIFILIPIGVGALSSVLTRDGMQDMHEIANPPFSPPDIVFSIVWPILFVLMGIGTAMIYFSDAETEVKKSALGIYVIQLIFNFFWTIWYFNLNAYLLAFIWLLALIVLVAIMVKRYYNINKTAGILQIPYFLWLLFAAYLNLGIYLLNK